MKARHFIIPVILLAAACQVEQPVDPSHAEEILEAAVADSVFTLTIPASKGEPDTKALDLVNDGKTLNFYWNDTETVKVYKDGTLVGTLSVTPGEGEKPTSATLGGDITVAGLAQGDQLTLVFPREDWDYTGQTGTLASIEAGYDYATATVTISEIIGNQVTATAASFANQQSVYRFGFKDGETYIDPKSFSISASGGKIVQSMSYSSGWTPAFGDITVTPASAAGDHFYYVSLQNQTTANDTYSFVITGSDDALYIASKAIPASVLDVPGKFISAKGVNATKPSFAPATSGAIEAPENVL